jgi:CheY-like chemotaxis protein
VLVVDDDARAADALASMLRGDGFSAEAFSDADAALRRLRSGGLHAIVADLEMPMHSGFRLLREGRPLLGGLAVFVVSAYARWQIERNLAALGVTKQFTKPLDYESLLTALRAAASTRLTDR